MFKSILVAIDDSECAQRALAIAIELGLVHTSKLTIVNVVDPIEASAPAIDPYGTIQPFLEGLTENAHRLMDESTAKATAAGLPANGLVLDGPPIAEIIRVARDGKHDLVIIGSHGRKGFSRLLAGSVAEGVMREAPCPTLVVH